MGTNAPTHALSTTSPGLSDQDLAILEFERHWWRYPGARDTAIHEKFGITPVRYFQVVNALIDRPEALAADPLLVRRLLRLRAERRDRRRAR